MEPVNDKEKYLMEEIDLYIRLLWKIQLPSPESGPATAHKTKIDLAKWYEGYLQEKLQ